MTKGSRVAFLVVVTILAVQTGPIEARDSVSKQAALAAEALETITGGVFFRAADRYRERRSIILGMCQYGGAVSYIVSVTGYKRHVVEKVIRKHGPKDHEADKMDEAWRISSENGDSNADDAPPVARWKDCRDSVPRR